MFLDDQTEKHSKELKKLQKGILKAEVGRLESENAVLKAELRMLRDGVQTMGDALADGVWAHLISSDDDLNALDVGVSSVVDKLTTLQTEVKRLQKDAERWNYGIQYGFPINFQIGWRAVLRNGNLTGGYPGFANAIDAIDAAMKEAK